jgi:hypothetical protein
VIEIEPPLHPTVVLQLAIVSQPAGATIVADRERGEPLGAARANQRGYHRRDDELAIRWAP